MSDVQIHDDRVCALGEGGLWHPERQQFYWFDILGKRFLTRDPDGPREWAFDEYVSAAGWVDRDHVLMASETALFLFNLDTGARRPVAPLDADNPHTRSNDGRADPQGGFWIGTMGKRAEQGAGAIYRFYRGRVERLFADISISNAISFAPDGKTAYFADSMTKRIMRQPLDSQGWPKGAASVFVDLGPDAPSPDGAVVDADGCLWNAQWGGARVARYAPDGRFMSAVAFPAAHTSCPAFGGKDLTTLFVTSATENIARPTAGDGLTYRVETGLRGQAEHRVILD